jgi:Putative capsular polysaccharide synthesis protein
MMLQRLKQNRQAYEYIAANLLVHWYSSTPILIYQMGRGGSSALRKSLMRCQTPRTNLVFHFHDFFPIRKMNPARLPIDPSYVPMMQEEIAHARRVYAAFPLKQKANWFFREYFYAGMIYQNIIRPHRPAKVITLVREPIGTNISMFFQVLERYTGAKYQADRFSTQELIDIFLTKYRFTRPLTWFDVELKPALGIDIYTYPFPQETGYLKIKSGNLELLTLQAEIPDTVKEQVIGNFLGIENLQLIRSNVSDEKKYARQYKEFKQQLRLPESFVQEMYASKFAKQFYSPAQLDALTSYWLNRGNDSAPTLS